MRYLALGDSISIDDYTGVPGGGAASQFACLVRADEFMNLTRNGATTGEVLASLDLVTARPDVVTLTAGGNDFLLASFDGADPGEPPGWDRLVNEPLLRLNSIAGALGRFECPVVVNTIYDPTDDDDGLSERMGLPASFRRAYNALNAGIRGLGQQSGFILSDLQALFHNHGIASASPWIVSDIEPNYDGATAIAREWYRLFTRLNVHA